MPEAKRKLFLIINRLSGAGGAVDTLTLAYGLASRYDITVVYGEKEKDEADTPLPLDETKIRFIKVHSLQRAISPVNDFFSLRTLAKLIETYQPDIVHTHGFKPGLLGRIATWRKKVPVIIHTYHGHVFHSYYSPRISKFISWLERKLALVSDRIVAISPQQAYELTSVYHIAPIEKIAVIFIGISEDYLLLKNENRNYYRNKFAIPEDAFVVAFIGRLVTVKNPDLFICVAERILQKNPDAYFLVIGDGNQKLHIQKELQRRRLPWQEGSKRVTGARFSFTGWIQDVTSVLAEINIVISTSLNEGTPVSLIEAQWMQKPVVAPNVGGVRDTIIDNETGFLVADFNVDTFDEKIQLLIRNKQLREDMGIKGEKFVKERFAKQKEVDAIDELYKNCLAVKKADK